MTGELAITYVTESPEMYLGDVRFDYGKKLLGIQNGPSEKHWFNELYPWSTVESKKLLYTKVHDIFCF